MNRNLKHVKKHADIYAFALIWGGGGLSFRHHQEKKEASFRRK